MSDAELVLAARRGDKRAFVEIVARHQAMVCGIALGILGDFAASEDAGQEAFLTAWRKFHDLREPERLRGWLGQIARNAALGQLRRRRGHETLDTGLAVTDESPTPDEAAATDEEAAMVRETLARLPEAQRLPLILYYREGQSVRAVAEALGISEDAAKQRLARGRELLRDRMSGVIETVLTRTKPNAVFTMTIAVAIGALVAPAVMAGTVLAAASAGGASVATTSTTPLLTAMSTSKAFLIAAGLVAVCCIPIGYKISGNSGAPRADVTAEPESTNSVVAAQAAQSNFETNALFAEWRDLHKKYGTNAEAMPQILKAINVMTDPFHRQGFRSALIAEWVQVDPAGGLAFFLQKGRDGSQRRQFFQEWLAKDPGAAVNALLAGGNGWDALARESLTDIARKAPTSVPQIAAKLPATDDYWDTSVRDAFAILAEGGLSAARKVAEALTGPSRDQALEGIAKAWAKSDLDAAINWAKGLPDGTDRNEVIRAALLGKATVDPGAALDKVSLVPAGGREAHFASTTGARVLHEAASANFDATVAWLTTNPGRLGGQELIGLAYPVTERLNADPTGFLSAHVADGSLMPLVPAIDSALMNSAGGQKAAVWDWLKTQPQTEAVTEIRRSILSSASYQDPSLAIQLVSDLPNTPDGDKDVKMVAERLFNGGQALHRFDRLMDEAPDRLQEPLVEAAFNLLHGEKIDDPQKWIDRLDLLPESSRPKGIESVARAWADQTPEDAAGWAASLAAGDAKNGAEAAVTSAWADKDPRGAAAWVATLPAGAERDRSAENLVMAVAQQYPQQAWDWAMSIGDAAGRERAATRAAQMMAARDPATALQLIQSSPFPDVTKALMQSSLTKRVAK
jgi:RNA polymerase sigma factor (sigma-70 family)